MTTPRVTVPVDDRPAFKVINDLFAKHGLDAPPLRLRDQLAEHLLSHRSFSAAPAPEGGATWFGVTGAADETEALAVALFDARCPGIRMTDEDLHYYRAAAQRTMRAVEDELDTPALAAREEAPAATAEREGDGHMSDCATHNAPALPVAPCDCGSPFLSPDDIKRAHELLAGPDSEDNERFASWYGDALLEVHQRAIQMDAALRAQPPAREDAQPWGYGFRRKRWGDAWSFSRSKRQADDILGYSDGEVQPLYTNHDPDALRVAVEALEPFAAACLDRESQNAKTLPGGASVRVTLAQCRAARRALAALQAEQKG